MTKKTFGWFPDASLRKSVTPPTWSLKFGEGYEQRAPEGITPILDQWQLKFTGTRAEIDEIEAFIKGHRGAYSFYWINPDERMGCYIVRNWEKGREHGTIASFSALFEEVPEL